MLSGSVSETLFFLALLVIIFIGVVVCLRLRHHWAQRLTQLSELSKPVQNQRIAVAPGDTISQPPKMRPKKIDRRSPDELYAVITKKRASKRARSIAFTQFIKKSPADIEDRLIECLDSEDAYLRVKVIAFTLRKGFDMETFPLIAARGDADIRLALMAKDVKNSLRAQLVNHLTRAGRTEFEPLIVQLLDNPTTTLRQEILEFLLEFGTAKSLPSLNAIPSQESFFLPSRKPSVNDVIEAIRARESVRIGALSVSSDMGGSLSLNQMKSPES